MRTLLLSAILLLAACSSPAPPPAPEKAPEPVKPKITQFYVSPNPVAPGQPAQLCWGTEDAVKLTLDPPIEEIKPSVVRCTEVNLKKTTSIKLTATSRDGLESFAQTTANVDPRATAPRPTAPLLQSVTFSALSVGTGDPVSICVDQRGATAVTLQPGGLTFPNQPHACIVSTFTRTTLVTVTATGPGGTTDKESATITVK